MSFWKYLNGIQVLLLITCYLNCIIKQVLVNKKYWKINFALRLYFLRVWISKRFDFFFSKILMCAFGYLHVAKAWQVMTLSCELVQVGVFWFIAKSMNIIDFINHFPDEESCEIYLKEHREKSGIRCKSCQFITKHYWFSDGKFFECSCCRRRRSLKSGTVMEKSYGRLFFSVVPSQFRCRI